MIEHGLVESAFYVPKTSLNSNVVPKECTDKSLENGVDVAKLNHINDDEDSLLKEIEEALNKKHNTTNYFKLTEDERERNDVEQDFVVTDALKDNLANSSPIRLAVDNWGFPLSIYAKVK